MRSFKNYENIHKKEGGSHYVVSPDKASSSILWIPVEIFYCNQIETGIKLFSNKNDKFTFGFD